MSAIALAVMHLAIVSLWTAAVVAVKFPVPASVLDSTIAVEPTSNCFTIDMFRPSKEPDGPNARLNQLRHGDITLTPRQFFVDNPCRAPKSGDCLFYGPRLSVNAQKYAEDTGQISIWDIWPEVYYETANIEANPMRCIMFDTDDRLEYFAIMSTSMAALCDTYAQYITVDPQKPNLGGFFGQFELEQMKRGGKDGRLVGAVDAITAGNGVEDSGLAGPGLNINRIYTRSAQTRRFRAREDYRVYQEAARVNATLYNDLVQRVPVPRIPVQRRAGCGAAPGVAAFFDECGTIPW